MDRIRLLVLALLSACPLICTGQSSMHAMVADSATLKPISSVTVRVLNSFRGTMTNEQGYFILRVLEKDTLQFSIVGYYPKKVTAKEIQFSSVIYLTQSVQMLKPIEIRGIVDISAVLPKLDEPSKYRNATMDHRALDVLGFQGIQTFGPGYISGFGDLKPSKEARKLERVKKENAKAKGYVALVNDPEVKDSLMKDYGLTEEQYYSHLARFNEKNKEFIYDLDDAEIVQLIFQYFMEVLKK